MYSMDLKERVEKMAAYLDAEAIASALKIPVETVNDILSGKAEIKDMPAAPVIPTIQVNSIKTAYRQRVIAVWRAKGGVGCTAVALYLAYILKDLMRVLLIDFNLADGGSDLSYYLELPDYPHLGVVKNSLYDALIQVEETFYVLQAPKKSEDITLTQETVDMVMSLARQDFDAVIVDLPNQEDEVIKEAVRCANTLVMVTAGKYQELVRIALRVADFKQKDVILAANKCSVDDKILASLGFSQSVVIHEDKDLDKTLESHAVPRRGSPFLKGLETLKEILYEGNKTKGGILRSLFAAG